MLAETKLLPQPIDHAQSDASISQYFSGLFQSQPGTLIGNLEFDGDIIDVQNFKIPILTSRNLRNQTYVASQYSHYITYAIEELRRYVGSPLRPLIEGFLRILGSLLQMLDFDRAVYPSNFLVSTNLHSKKLTERVKDLTQILSQRLPQHSIIIRSVHEQLNADLYSKLKQLGYLMIPSRKTYLIDCRDEKVFKRKNFRHDYRLIEQNGYHLESIGRGGFEDYGRLAELYRLLYIEKFSALNPQYTAAWFKLAFESGFCSGLAVVKGRDADGFLGYFRCGDVIATPCFGYDTSLPQIVGLYRMISAASLIEGRRLGCISHESSGAARYKVLRGASSAYEYSAVYVSHLKIRTRVAWRIIQFLSNVVGRPIIEKNQL